MQTKRTRSGMKRVLFCS